MSSKWKQLGSRLLGTDGTIYVYEAFSVYYVFCEGMFEQKIKELFTLFDFDSSGQIDFAELFLALQSTIFGICKFLGFPIPSFASVRVLAQEGFKIIDSDNNDS